MSDGEVLAEELLDPDDLVEDIAEDSDIEELAQELQARCEKADLRLDVEQYEGETYRRVYLPAGPEVLPISLSNIHRLRAFLDVPFERYVLLSDYAGYASYEDGFVEVKLSALSPDASMAMYRRFRNPLAHAGSRKKRAAATPFRVANPDGPEVMIVGPASEALGVLGGSTNNGYGSPFRLGLRIEGLDIERHDQTVEILEKLSQSLFFQMDIALNAPLTLAARRRPTRRRPKTVRPNDSTELEFPRSEYDQDPVSLYWYARSATGMPLLQFLAYYQTVEFYFPTYSQAEARRKIRNLLKNPTFRVDRDADLARVLVAARPTGQGYGDERTQLRATVNECIELGALREFLSASEAQIDFFSRKTKGLTEFVLPIRTPGADLRGPVADRIYDIRCKIVHTKSGGRDGEMQLLLPFSKEAELLYEDIDLIRYVAQEVLVSASSSLTV